jgi:hypothetical protein
LGTDAPDTFNIPSVFKELCRVAWHQTCNILLSELASRTLVAAQMLQGGAMLRVQIQDCANGLTLKLEGRFTGDDAENTRVLITRFRDGMRFVLDLTGVTFIDSVGEEVLSFFGRFGAEFVAPTSYTLDVCERLHLHLANAGDTSGASPTNGHRRRAHVHQPKNEEV